MAHRKHTPKETRVDCARSELRASEERFRLLVESVQDYAIFLLDPTGHVETWNAGAKRMKGYEADEIIGRHFSVFYPPDAQYKCAIILAEAAEHLRTEDEGWRVRKDGSRFWANVVITALREPDGTLVGFAKVTRDLTERRRAEEERIKLAEAIEAHRTKDEFLATMSHELRTPLNAILGWAALLGDRVTDPEIAKPIAIIRRNADAQAKIIADVLDVSRIVAGKLRLDVRRMDLAAVVRNAIEVVRPAADAKKVTIEADGADLPVEMVGDAMRLEQVVWNLLSNAVKFSRPGGSVRVRLDTKDAVARLSVTDAGVGIDPTFLPLVFERFRQADSSSTRKHGGLGLGLAIVKHITELHRGRVEAASEGIGKGATFSVTLPCGDASVQSTRSTEAVPQASPLGGVHVLVLEDEDDARELLVDVLASAGATVRSAGSAREARARLSEHLPDVLVSDIAMPDEDGYDLVRWMRTELGDPAASVYTLAVSAHAGETARAKAIAAGFDAYIAKPVDPKEILRRVRHGLRR